MWRVVWELEDSIGCFDGVLGLIGDDECRIAVL